MHKNLFAPQTWDLLEKLALIFLYNFHREHGLIKLIRKKLSPKKQCEVGLFFVFRFSLFVFRYSFFVIRFSLFVFRFDIQNPILTFEIGPNIVFRH